MGWFSMKQALLARDLRWLVALYTHPRETDPQRSLELALREMGHGPLKLEDHPQALGLRPAWQWCVPHRTAYNHGQALTDEHRSCNGSITIPLYAGNDVSPGGAVLDWKQDQLDQDQPYR